MCALILRTGGTVLSQPLTDDAHRDSWNGWFGRELLNYLVVEVFNHRDNDYLVWWL